MTSGLGRSRVKVMNGTRALKNADLSAYVGVVILRSKGSRRRLRKAGFEHLYRYLALPSIENPRWLLPVEQASTGASFTLPRMYKLTSRLMRLGLIIGLKLGTTFWKQRTIAIASRREPQIVSAITPLFPRNKVRLAFAGGTPGPMRKPTVVCLDADGPALAYAKVATSPVSEALVRNEARVLRLIAATPRLLRLAPRLLLDADCDGRTVVVASTLGGNGISGRFGKLQRRFLDALKSDDIQPVYQNQFLIRLARDTGGRGEEQLERLLHDARSSLATAELPQTLMHGDATPWNMRKKQGAIVAFDWEYGVVDGLPVLDELHYRWSTALLLQHRSVAKVVHGLDTTARNRSRLEPRQAAALVDVYLIHGLIHRLDMGCGEDDELVAAYREALALRINSTEAAR